MSRLIDADKLMVELREIEADGGIGMDFITFEDLIKEQPSAFDVGKVISNIWDRSELIHIKDNYYDEIEDYIRVIDVCEIVKAGGIK